MLDLSRKLTDKLVIDDKEYALDLSFNNVLKLFEMWRDEDVPEFVKPHFGIRILTGETLEDFTVEEMAEIFNEVFEEHISLSEVEDNHVEYDLAGNPMKTTASDEPKRKHLMTFVMTVTISMLHSCKPTALIYSMSKVSFTGRSLMLYCLDFQRVLNSWKLSKFVNGNRKRATQLNTKKKCVGFKKIMLSLTRLSRKKRNTKKNFRKEG